MLLTSTLLTAALLSAAQVAAPAQGSAPARITGFEDLSGFDKIEHATANVVVTDTVWLVAALLEQPLWVRVVAGCTAGVVVSLAKETYDLAGYGDPSLGDLTYDALGIAAGVGFALTVESLVARLEPSPADAAPQKGQAALSLPSSRISP